MAKRKQLAKDIAKQHPPGKDRRKNIEGICGAIRKNGRPCGLRAGHGTSHTGIGRCKLHGGAAPNGIANVAKQTAIFMGAPKDINPIDAILWCIRIAAGEVEWLSARMEEIEQEDWYEFTPLGKQLHVLARERAAAQERLVKFSKDAISMGLAERAVRLAEIYGNSIAILLTNIAAELDLTQAQKARWPMIVRRQLAALQRGYHNGVVLNEDEDVVEGKVLKEIES